MKPTHLLLYLCFILSASCASEDTDDEAEEIVENLSGTWLLQSEITIFDVNSGLKIGSSTTYSTFFIAQSDTDISITSCAHSLDPTRMPLTLIKDDNTLLFSNDIDEPFTIISSNELSRQYELTSSSDRSTYDQTYTKISSTIAYDQGHLKLNGAVNADNSHQVCLNLTVGENNDFYKYKISIPLDNQFVTFSIGSTQALIEGDYQYDINAAGSSPVIFSFDVTSNTDIFASSFNTNTLSPDFANLEITASQPDLIEGNFSFISQIGGDFTGTFSFVPY